MCSELGSITHTDPCIKIIPMGFEHTDVTSQHREVNAIERKN